MIRSIFILMAVLSSTFGAAQSVMNTLPEFSVKELTKGKIQISWNNPYPSCIQLAIQRSTDSSTNFRTLFSSLSPELPANGFVDNKPPKNTVVYYRIFYVLSGGAYYFSKVKSVTPAPITIVEPKKEIPIDPISKKEVEKKIERIPEKPKAPETSKTILHKEPIRILLNKTQIYQFTWDEYKEFRDSINKMTRDALTKLNETTIEFTPTKKKPKKEQVWVYRKMGPPWTYSKNGYLIFKDSIFRKTNDTLIAFDDWHKLWRGYVEKPKEIVNIFRNDSLLFQLNANDLKRFRDSISTRTKDTLYITDKSRTDIHPFLPKYVWKPSKFIYTNTIGYVNINLPLFKEHKYHIVFFEEDGSELFRIRTIKEAELTLDKTNFIHAGWFYFELYEDDKLKEKSKFQIPKN